MKTLLTFAMALLLSCSALAQEQPAQVMHITSIHQATDREKTYRTAFGQQFIETTIGTLHYTLAGLSGFFGCNVEVGADYPLVKANQKGVTIKCPVRGKAGKQGKTFNATFSVMTVEEIGKAN